MEQTTGDENLYGLVSGFYGPGSMGCWYLLTISVFASWIFDSRYRFCVTNDFIAVVAYPIVAAGHLIIQIANFPQPRAQYLVANLSNLVTGNHGGPVMIEQKDSGVRYLLDLTSSDRTDFYPRVAAINAALRVVDNHTYLALIALLFSAPEKNITKVRLKQRHRSLLIICANLVWSWAAELFLIIKICNTATYGRADPFWCSFLARLVLPPLAFLWGMVLAVIILIIKGGLEELLRICRLPDPLQRTRQQVKDWTAGGLNPSSLADILKKFLIHVLILLAILALLGFYAFMHFQNLPVLLFFPPVGTSLAELDQAAALAGGLFNLGLTFYRIPWAALGNNDEILMETTNQ